MPLNTDPVINVPIMAMSTQEIPGCTVQLLTCKVKGDVNVAGEGLIETSDTIESLPNYLCVARSLTTVIPGNRVMPFGVTNVPATFKRLIECVLAGLTSEQHLIYLDDVIVLSSTFEEHLRRLSNMFIALRKSGLKLNSSKCFFV